MGGWPFRRAGPARSQECSESISADMRTPTREPCSPLSRGQSRESRLAGSLRLGAVCQKRLINGWRPTTQAREQGLGPRRSARIATGQILLEKISGDDDALDLVRAFVDLGALLGEPLTSGAARKGFPEQAVCCARYRSTSRRFVSPRVRSVSRRSPRSGLKVSARPSPHTRALCQSVRGEGGVFWIE
jgi:hypothetical protein